MSRSVTGRLSSGSMTRSSAPSTASRSTAITLSVASAARPRSVPRAGCQQLPEPLCVPDREPLPVVVERDEGTVRSSRCGPPPVPPTLSGEMADVRDRIVDFALGLPGAFEDHPWGETVAKVGRGKVFVFFGPAESGRLTVKLDESHGHALALEGAARTGYGLGKSGWVTLPLDAAPPDVLRDFVEESY